jgi:hypothetical protein
VLAGLFGRAPHPELKLVVQFRGFNGSVGRFPIQLTFQIDVLNVGRGIAEDLFFLADEDLPANCIASFPRTEHWEGWKNGTQTTLISKSFPRLPPGSQNVIVDVLLSFPTLPAGDVVLDLTCGSRSGPGVNRRIVFPADALLRPALEQFTTVYPNATARKPGDDHWRNQIAAHLVDRG